MAKASILISEDEFSCSICLDLLKDPVTLACGHSFCMSCITSSWDLQLLIFRCPQCRETFDKRPALRRNNMLAGVVEKIRKTGPQLSDPCHAKPGDVECDICTGSKYKAVKSCLVCLASYCEVHFQPHKESSALMKHTVIEASAKLHEKICSQHGKRLEVFCRTDQKCICYLCTLDEHSNHNTVSTMAERAEKEKQVVVIQNKYSQRILEREGYCLELEKSLGSIKHSAKGVVEDTERMFHELIQSVEKKCSEVTTQIRAQEKVELNRTKEHLKQVEQEIVELKSKNEELKQLSQTQDDILYFQMFQSFIDHGLPEAIPRVKINMPHSYEDVKIFVHKLKKRIESTKLCPNSSSQMNSQQTSQNSQNAWHPEQSTVISSKPATVAMQQLIKATPVKAPAESQTTVSTPATQSQAVFGLSSTPATQSQSLFRLSSTPATQSQSLFRLSSTPATQSQSLFRLSSTPATQSQSLFQLSSTPATQSHSAFGSSLKLATQSLSMFGSSSTPATQSQSVFGSSSTPATQSQSVFGSSSTPATSFKPVFGSSSTPATQFQPVFGSSLTPATQSQPIFQFSRKLAAQSQSMFGSSSTPATQSQSLFESTLTPATQSQSILGSSSSTATQSQSVSGFSSATATQSQSTSIFTIHPTSAAESQCTQSTTSKPTIKEQ